MNQMKRYAVYFAPRPGAFADRAGDWLGRDVETGAVRPQPDLPGLPAPAANLTVAPRRYGFHGTIRAPFRLGDGVTPAAVAERVAQLAAAHAPVICDGLHLQNLHGFLALTPHGDQSALLDLGAAVVRGTNDLRAPLTAAEIARRAPETLSPRQRQLLDDWGYPSVMEAFRFHLTLTDSLPPATAQATLPVLQAHLAPVLPRPFVLQDLCLFGEYADGLFHLLHRYALRG